MTLEAAIAHGCAGLDDVARTLCRLATLSFALGEVDRCRDSVDAAAELLRERGEARTPFRPTS
jgi:hypothetical protein